MGECTAIISLSSWTEKAGIDLEMGAKREQLKLSFNPELTY